MMLLEAASVGTPILCSDIPENVTVLPEQALFFVSANTTDLQEKLAWALEHPTEMTQLGQAAQTWVQKTYDWQEIVQQYEQLYQEVIS